MNVNLGPRTRKALKIAGYIVLGLVVFVYGVHLSFPYKRAAERGKDALRSRYIVHIKDVKRGWLPGDFTLDDVTLTSRTTKADEVAKVIMIDEVAVNVKILSMLSGSADVGIDAKVGGGSIAGTVTVAKDRLQASMGSRNLPLSDVPGLASIIGMPMGGNGNVSASIDLPRGDWRQARAKISIDCPGCTIGGPGAFFKPRTTRTATAGFVGKGVPVPLLQLTSLKAEWQIEGGKIKTNRFEFLSPHLTVELDFSASIEKELKNSRVEDACLRYRGTDELKALDNDFYNALELTGGPLVSSDNLRHLKLVGTLGNFKALGKECGGSDSPGDGGGGGTGVGTGDTTSRRPNLGDVPTDPDTAAVQPGPPIDAAGGPAMPPDAHPVNPQPDDGKVVPQPEGGQLGEPTVEGGSENGMNGQNGPPVPPEEIQPPAPGMEGAEPPPPPPGTEGELQPSDGTQSVPPPPPPENE